MKLKVAATYVIDICLLGITNELFVHKDKGKTPLVYGSLYS